MAVRLLKVKALASKQVKPKPLPAPARLKAKATPGKLVPAMNGLETRYHAYLELQFHAGTIRWFRYEGIKLELGDGAWFTVDFCVVTKDERLEFHETKGRMMEAARVRLLTSARQYPFVFKLIKEPKPGVWEITEI